MDVGNPYLIWSDRSMAANPWGGFCVVRGQGQQQSVQM
jgi:hypothetical protein